jgi:hypothetical protein
LIRLIARLQSTPGRRSSKRPPNHIFPIH